MNGQIIEVENLWKCYYVTQEKRRTLKETVLKGFGRMRRRQTVWALQDVSFKLEAGRTLGIIGNNGAGKSSLLRLVCGLGRPTRGAITVRDRVSSLLELGTGFHPDLTGRENIYIGGLVAGLTREEVSHKLDPIIEFAELEAVIDTPLRTYSSGMYLRLAFATAINYDPGLLVVDEALSVGDIRFQKKCLTRMQEMKQGGTTIVVVSHVMSQIEDLCDEVLWLEQGKVRLHGPTPEVIKRYQERVFTRVVASPGMNRSDGDELNTPGEVSVSDEENSGQFTETLSGTHQIEIRGVRISNEFGTEIDTLVSGEPLQVQINYFAREKISRPIFMVGIFRDDGLKCYESSTEADGIFIETVEGTGFISINYAALPLLRGSYWLGVSIFDQHWETAYDYKGQMSPFEVVGTVPGTGIFHPPHKWSS